MSEHADPSDCHVVVVGSMGVGKSTTAEALAAVLDRDHLDADQLLERRHGATGRQLTATHGVNELHRLEAAVALEALAHEEPAVISLAASAITNETVRTALADHRVAWLQLDAETVVQRQAAGDHRRPMQVEEVAALQRARHDDFAAVADLEVDASPPVQEVVTTVLAHLDQPRHGQSP